MRFTDILYVYKDGVDGDVGPNYLDFRKTRLAFAMRTTQCLQRLECEPYQPLPTDLAEKIPDIDSRLERAGMRKRNSRGSSYELHFDVGMTFDNEIKFHLIFEGECDQPLLNIFPLIHSR